VIPSSSSSLVSTLAPILMIVGIGVYVLALPSVRHSVSKKLDHFRAFFFHESELHPVKVESPVQAEKSAPKDPLAQIEPAGWDYSIYAPIKEPPTE